MTSPTPDISQLSISGSRDESFNDHQHKTFHYSTSPPPPVVNTQFPYAPATTGPQSAKKPARAGLPSHWMDGNQQQPLGEERAFSPPHTSDISSSGSPPPPQVPHIQQPMLYGEQQYSASNNSGEDDIIPNAIVIKNIPFTVKREALLEIITSLNIPTPYAFNYHIDTNGQFRGLAFANFRQAADADAVVVALNGFDVQGRKLRVEYKKVLQAGEKERIEREKALRRMRSMQLEKERDSITRNPNGDWDAFSPVHNAPMPAATSLGSDIGGVNPLMPGMPAPSPTATRSYSSVGLGMPNQSPIGVSGMPMQSMPQPYPSPPPMGGTPAKASAAATELDLNDASTLEIYSRILIFKEDRMRDELAFSRNLTPKQRRIVHLVAQKLGVYHYSVGEGEDRYAVVTRIPREDGPRQPVRHASQTLHRSPSAYLNPSPGSVTASQSSNGLSPGMASAGLRYKKSMPDLNSLHAAPRLQTRASNSNIREGYATIANSPRRTRNEAFNSLFASTNGTSGTTSDIPPVPMLPTIPSMEGGVVRQPRGPGSSGFAARRPTADTRTSGSGASGGLDTRSHEPLEI
ncbi:hypothetical protein M407DRAFT_93716 [Tulasnella calospora MUT 4182]|uniref:RRM domain-containing protein n=1 Tax=Tulasnella calospora MUT 4182 TaxID=1051891 RepID=A0A0C3KUH0_9AGAM|nr:hypothetical protein M407DRAFT_93716 [Tulasnella calospora MUT 4182]